MNKGSIVLGLAAALIGGGLIWAAGSKEDSGIAGWETLNVRMEQAVGGTVVAVSTGAMQKVEATEQAKATEQASATEHAKATEQASATEHAIATEQGIQAAQPTADNKGATVAEQKDKAEESIVPPPTMASQEGKINVNTANAAELMELPGIGEKRAQDIMDYRSREGSFRSLTDLGKVKGIGPKMLEKLKSLVIF